MNTREFLTEGRRILRDLGLETTLGLDNAKVRAGVFHIRENRITLSKGFVALNDWETVHNTLLHEAAHALAPPRSGHGPEWVKQCHILGIKPERCYDGDEVAMPPAPYAILCTGCEKVVGERHRRVRLEGRFHKTCRGNPLRLIRNPVKEAA